MNPCSFIQPVDYRVFSENSYTVQNTKNTFNAIFFLLVSKMYVIFLTKKIYGKNSVLSQWSVLFSLKSKFEFVYTKLEKQKHNS